MAEAIDAVRADRLVGSTVPFLLLIGGIFVTQNVECDGNGKTLPGVA